MAKLIETKATKADEISTSDAQRSAENRSKADNLKYALDAFRGALRSKAECLPSINSGNGIQSIMGGAMLSSIEVGPEMVVPKVANVALHPKVACLNLSRKQATLLSLLVKADERERGCEPIEISRSDAASVLGVTPDEGEAIINSLRAHGLLDYRDNGSGQRGFFPCLPT